MKSHIRILSMMLVICMFTMSINVYSLDAGKVVEKEHTFTRAELASMTDGLLGTSTSLTEEFIEVKNIEGKTTRESTTYYIIEKADGYMLTSQFSGSLSITRYANSASNDIRKWIFSEDSEGNYIVFSYTDSSKCLTIDPSTKIVTLNTYTGSELQKWKMYFSSNGNTLSSMATDSRVSGYKLVIGSTSCSVSNTTYTPVGFFDVSWFTPVETLSHPDFYLALEQRKTVTPTKSPTNANISNYWINWSSSNHFVATVNDIGLVTGVSAGVTLVVFRDKITRKYGTCMITVMPIANGTYFLQNKENSDYAKVKNVTMTDGQNVVQYDFDGSMAERWIFALDTTTGYFSIRSANSSSTNYYMAVSDDSSALDKPIVIRSATEATLTEGMKWKVETTANGAYKIIPKTGEATNYVLATSVSTGTNNNNLLQGDYIDNNSYRDEWFLTRIQYSATVYNFYDKGYCVRYGETESASIGKINSYLDDVAKQYLKLLGLELSAPNAAYYVSAIDACKETVSSSNIDALCTHTNSHTILLNSPNSVSTHFNGNTNPSGSNVITKAYWSGHRIKTYSDVEEYNRCYSSGTSIFMIELSSSSVRDRDSKGILMHELNHQYGARDHYHEILDEGTANERCRGGEFCTVCGSSPRPQTCIMNRSRIDINNSTVICTECRSDMNTHLEDHH